MEILLVLFMGTTIIFIIGVGFHIKIYYGSKKRDKEFYERMTLILGTMKNTIDKMPK